MNVTAGLIALLVFVLMMIISVLLLIIQYLIKISKQLELTSGESMNEKEFKREVYKSWLIAFIPSLAIGILTLIIS